MTLFIIIGLTVRIEAIEYHLEEDFSDSNLLGWTMNSNTFENESTTSQIYPIDHTWVVEEGKLKSNGEFNPEKLQRLMTEDPTNYGVWSLDVKVPANLTLNYLRYSWTVGVDDVSSREWLTGSTIFAFFFNGDAIDSSNSGGGTQITNLMYDVEQHYDLIRTEDRTYVFVDQQKVFDQKSVRSDRVPAYFMLRTYQGSLVEFDNIQISADYVGKLQELGVELNQTGPTGDVSGGILALGVGIIVVTSTTIGLGYRFYKKKRLEKLIRKSSPENYPMVSNTISSLLDNNLSLYYLLLGQKNDHLQPLSDRIESSLSKDLNNYRRLFHPFRLSIMKLVHKHEKISSLDLKESLNISWSDYYNSIRALEKYGMVTLDEDFDDTGILRQVVILQDFGRNQFEELVELLNHFVEFAKEDIPNINHDRDLYPKSNWPK